MTWRAAAAAALVIAGGLGAASSPARAESQSASAAAPRLAAAFAAAYPQATVAVGDQKVEFRPALIERVGPGTFALVSAGQVLPAARYAPPGHPTFGYASIAYLRAGPKLALMAKPTLIEKSMGGFGAPPGIHALPGLSRTPTIALVSSYTGQGVSDRTATLVSLGPTPGAIGRPSDDIAIGRGDANVPCRVEGEIVAIAADKVFEVRFRGAFHGRERFVFSRGRWRLRGTEVNLEDYCA